MEIIELIGWVLGGFIPTFIGLEIASKRGLIHIGKSATKEKSILGVISGA